MCHYVKCKRLSGLSSEKILCTLLDSISKSTFMISGIFGMNLKSYLEEHVVSYCLQSYSMHDLLGSFLKLLAISLVKLTIFVVVMQFAFWLTTSGIIISSIVVFFLMYNYLRARKIF
jgi:magnesium transporter